MSDFDSSKMDGAASDASSELETIREEHPDGVKAVEDWAKNGFHQLVINALVKFLLIGGTE